MNEKDKNIKNNQINNDENLIREMSYEMAGDIGAIDNEDMVNNRKITSGDMKNQRSKQEKKSWRTEGWS
ncbi:hypothetical protein [Sporosalibacterium faouarense]|uniref:hypothetical protein n=1 Tax=Sporosalibacterium faouarense TaxID=516123 RepID=UPI00192BE1A5|nr:hypothetical protein [Sporosalibacterium faouarense]